MKRETRIGLGVGLLLILGFGLILSEITNSRSQRSPSPDDDNDTVYVATSRHVRPVGRSQARIGEAVTPPPSYRRTTQRRSAPATQPTQPPQQRDRRVEAADVMLAATAGQSRQPAAQADPPATSQGPPRPQFAEMDARQLQAYVRSSASPATQVYVVKSGDTLTGIARRFMGDGSWATVRKLYEMNRNTLSDPDRLDVGMRLIVPAGRGRDD